MTKLKKALNVFYSVVLVFLVIVASLVALTNFDLSWGVKVFNVQSGSMEPKLPTGSIVFTLPAASYNGGDIITFKSDKDRKVKRPKYTTTHRVVRPVKVKGETYYVTKGDANAVPDSEKVKKDLVLGKVVFSIPLIGYPVNFAKTLPGLIFLIVIPATLIIYSELISIKNEAFRLVKEKVRKKNEKKNN